MHTAAKNILCSPQPRILLGTQKSKKLYQAIHAFNWYTDKKNSTYRGTHASNFNRWAIWVRISYVARPDAKQNTAMKKYTTII